MKTNVVISLDTRVARTNGTYPLILRIVHNRLTAQIPLGIYQKERDWDAQHRLIKSSYKGTESITRLNNQIQKRKVEAMDKISQLQEKKILQTLYHPNQIKELLEQKNTVQSFLSYMQELIDTMTKVGRIGT